VRERGSFDSFMDLYLERWLHSYVDCVHGTINVPSLLSLCSDQLITLTTVVPPKLVRITGITHGHGLLRTMPERTGWPSGDEGFYDLQPDGNSFDMMAGLIKSKSSH
jgi:biotin--protein ligase